MDNIIVYIETGSSSVSEGKKPVKDSESAPLSEQDIPGLDISEQEAEPRVSQDISEDSESESEVTKDEAQTLEDKRIDMVRFNRYIVKWSYFDKISEVDRSKMNPTIRRHKDLNPLCNPKIEDLRDPELDRWVIVRDLIQRATVENRSLADLLSEQIVSVTEAQKDEIINHINYTRDVVEEALDFKDELYALLSSDKKSWVNALENTINPDGKNLHL